MKKTEIMSALFEAFAHANVLLSIARDGDIEIKPVPDGISIRVLNEAAARYMKEIHDTKEGQLAIQFINELMSKNESIDDIVFVAPHSIDWDAGTLACEITRTKSTLH